MSGIRGDLYKFSGSLVKTLHVGTRQVTYAGLSIKTPGFSSKVHVKPSFQYPPLLRLPLNQTQHFEVFKISKFLFYHNKNLSNKSEIYCFKKIYIFLFFEKYTLEININRFKIKVIKFAINIGVEEIL